MRNLVSTNSVAKESHRAAEEAKAVRKFIILRLHCLHDVSTYEVFISVWPTMLAACIIYRSSPGNASLDVT